MNTIGQRTKACRCGADATARTSYAASYPDALGRTIATAANGTNGSLNGSGGWSRPHTAPSRSDDILVQSTIYNTAGNAVNQIAADATITTRTFDAAGNMLTMPKPGAWDTALHCTWDAWNRLVKVRYPASGSSSSSDSSWSDSSSSDSSWSDSSSSDSSDSSWSDSSTSDSSWSDSCSSGDSSSSSAETFEECVYQYDALTRRVMTTVLGETRDIYFNRQWRAIEERVANEVKAQYVWNPGDRWDLLQRKRSVYGLLDETRYVLRDNLDPVAIIDTSGVVTERYRYDAFGPVSILTEEFSPRSISECAWNYLYHAEFRDSSTGLYNYGYRYYHPNLGRWISRDPIGERGGVNLYGFVGNNGVNYWDVLGMEMKQYKNQSAIPKPVDNWKHDLILNNLVLSGVGIAGDTSSKWPLRQEVIKCDGCVLKVSDIEMTVSIDILRSYLDGENKNTKAGKSNLTTIEHERRHENHAEANWNAAAKLINPFHNTVFKSESCCLKYAAFLKQVYTVWETISYLNDEIFDCEEYKRCEGVENARNRVLEASNNIIIPNCDD